MILLLIFEHGGYNMLKSFVNNRPPISKNSEEHHHGYMHITLSTLNVFMLELVHLFNIVQIQMFMNFGVKISGLWYLNKAFIL